MSDQTALLRQWILLRLLVGRNPGLTIRELSAETEVSEKTIRRDLVTFQTAGFRLEETSGDYGRKSYRVLPNRDTPDLTFTFEEALALYLGRQFFEPLAGTMLGDAAQRAFSKIRASLSAGAIKYLDKMGDAFQETRFGNSDYSRHREILDNVQIGIEDRRVVWITYRSQRSTEPVTYDIHPYRFLRHLGSLYLLGYKPQDEQLRTWRVDRIEAAEVDRVPFARPKEADLESRLAGAFGIYDGGTEQRRVRLRFLPPVARFIQEKRWHSSQQFFPHRDGSVIVEFRLSSTVEVKDWVLSFGCSAEVLEPESLRTELVHELEQTLARYGSPLSASSPRADGKMAAAKAVPSPRPSETPPLPDSTRASRPRRHVRP